MEVAIEESWKNMLKDEFALPYFTTLQEKVRKAYLGNARVYPPPELVFNAFALCPFDTVKVVILGQDPYHGEGQAHGLCFSVQDGVRIPPSLKNIYKEIKDDLSISNSLKPLQLDAVRGASETRDQDVLSSTARRANKRSNDKMRQLQRFETGNLERWARQGVLLLNTTLTVEEGKPASHQGLGWERFSDAIIRTISENKEHVVFLLWGKYAQNKSFLIDDSKHLVLMAPHPSPFSAHTGFLGCKHFSKTNLYLQRHAQAPIEW